MKKNLFPKYLSGVFVAILLGVASGFVFYKLSPDTSRDDTKIAKDILRPVSQQNDPNVRPISYDKLALQKLKAKIPIHIDTANLSKLPLRAAAYLVRDMDTGEDLLARQATSKYPIASVTKLVTAMVALDNIKSTDIVKISKSAVGTYGFQGHLSAGERFVVGDLINCLLLESSNDAAEALAEHYGRDKFLTLMRDKVKSFDMNNTEFLDPSGLSKGNQSTSDDLSKLMAHIESNRPDILAIAKKRSFLVPKSALSNRHVWLNINRLVKDNNPLYLGGKDGFTGDALMTFAGAFAVPISDLESKHFSIALLRSSDRNGDVKKIIDRVVASLRYDNGLAFKMPVRDKRGIAEDTNISLLFVGNIALRSGSHDTFEFVPFLKEPDILVGNLEGPASDLGYDVAAVGALRMDPSVIPRLKDAGFDALSLANGHIGDRGLTALEDTLGRLRSAEIVPVGAGQNGVDARNVRIFERGGIKIGLMSFSDVGPAWMAQHDNLPTVLMTDDPHFDSIIRTASAKVNYLAVSFRFKDDASGAPTDHERYLAHKAIDAGAKIVIGYHPRVGAEIENYNGGVIDYGLGDFIYASSTPASTPGSILEVILDKQGILQVNRSDVGMNVHNQPVLLERSEI